MFVCALWLFLQVFVDKAELSLAKYEMDLAAFTKAAPPKKPQSSYFIFCGEKRAEIIASNPGVKISEVGKLTGQMWKEITEQERKVYSDKAAVLKTKYNNSKAAKEESTESVAGVSSTANASHNSIPTL
jgi:hypothetical protein